MSIQTSILLHQTLSVLNMAPEITKQWTFSSTLVTLTPPMLLEGKFMVSQRDAASGWQQSPYIHERLYTSPSGTEKK